jgi:hypothetical protein
MATAGQHPTRSAARVRHLDTQVRVNHVEPPGMDLASAAGLHGLTVSTFLVPLHDGCPGG